MTGRPDNPEYLYHFTGRPRTTADTLPSSFPRTADGRLGQILAESALRARAVFNTKQRPVICFSELSNAGLKTLLRDGFTGRGRYEPWGLIFRKSELIKSGARPVWYMNDDEMDATSQLDPKLLDRRVRYVPVGDALVDWTHEREWRLTYGDVERAELGLTSKLVVGAIVGSTEWNPHIEESSAMYQVSRYLWNGRDLLHRRWVGGGWVRRRGTWPLDNGLDFSDDEPFYPPDEPEPDDYEPDNSE